MNGLASLLAIPNLKDAAALRKLRSLMAVYPGSLKVREKFLRFPLGQILLRAWHRFARRVNALVLLDGGWS